MVDMAEGSPLAKRLFERVHESTVARAALLAQSGGDILQMGSDVATQRGPLMGQAMWREPRSADHARLHPRGKKGQP